MDTTKLTVLFEEPFWIGLCEREESGRYRVCKITFGAEPKDYEVYDFLLKNWEKLPFSPTLEGAIAAERRLNPKRLQRQIRKRTESAAGIGTKAQQALKLQREEGKLARKTVSKVQREIERQRQFDLKQNRKKEKHRGH